MTRIVQTKTDRSDRGSVMKKGRSLGTRGSDANIIKTGGRFTNTAVPKFKGDSCWQQHLQIFQAIVKSNGWTDETAALQLFVHLDGEALKVALLMPEGERADWTPEWEMLMSLEDPREE